MAGNSMSGPVITCSVRIPAVITVWWGCLMQVRHACTGCSAATHTVCQAVACWAKCVIAYMYRASYKPAAEP
jgi:hypothetical protein